jgi:TonB family protein
MVAPVGLLALSGCARAADIQQPVWQEKPSGSDFARVFPTVAQLLNVEGHAVVRCTVGEQGALGGCAATQATPAGLGFDQAAIALAAQFRMRPTTADGHPVLGGVVEIPFRFRLPSAPAEAAADPQPVAPAPAGDLGLARQLIALSGYAEGFGLQLDQGIHEIEHADNRALDPKVLKDAVAILQESRGQIVEQLAETSAQQAAYRLSPTDLSAGITFLQSPTFQAFSARLGDADGVWRGVAHDDWQRVKSVARSSFCAARDCRSPTDDSLDPSSQALPKGVARVAGWLNRPSFDQIEAAYPRIPWRMGIDGWVDMRCRADSQGLLSDCAIAVEKPAGLGFGSAALKLSRRFQAPPRYTLAAARPVVDVPIEFISSGESPRLAPPPPDPSPAHAVARQIVLAQDAVSRTQGDAERWVADADSDAALGVPAATRADAIAAYRNARAAALPALVDAAANVYQLALTEAQMRAVLAFEHSPAGLLVAGRDSAFEAAVATSRAGIMRKAGNIAHDRFCKLHDCALPAPRP